MNVGTPDARISKSSGPVCRLFKASGGVGTILASLGAALSTASFASLVKRMRTLKGGIYEVPPFFLFALISKGGPVGASLAAVTHRTFKAVYSLARRSQQRFGCQETDSRLSPIRRTIQTPARSLRPSHRWVATGLGRRFPPLQEEGLFLDDGA
jgi:hypothetical protein